MDSEWQIKKYTGSERRSQSRRKSSERRGDIRWEPVQNERRSGSDRRKLSEKFTD